MTVWIPTAVLSRALGVSDRGARHIADKVRHRHAKRGNNGRAIEVDLDALELARPGSLQAVLQSHPHLAPVEAGDRHQRDAAVAPPPARSYADAPDPVRARADRRLQAVLSYREAITPAPIRNRRERETAWLARFRRQHPEIRVSLPSVRRWSALYEAHGKDGLVDGNDGSGRRGRSKVPSRARTMFLGWWLDENCRSVALAIRETRRWAADAGVEIPEADAPFYRLAGSVPKFDRAAYRESADKPAEIFPFVERDYESLPALDTIESDHHQIDVGVRCDAEECRRVHFPWLTAWMDVRSRKILAWELSIDAPNSSRILAAFRSVVHLYGLPNRGYVDNGKDYRKALGKRFWRDREGKALTTDREDDYFKNIFFALGIQAQFARPYNAKAKAIERLFRTLIEGCWKTFESYRGPLGRRPERAARLHNNPASLPTLHELRDALAAEIYAYHERPHRGRGMNRQAPNAVFDATRIARRDPDRFGFAQIFWRPEHRKVDRGRIRVNGLTYRIASAAHYGALHGETVRVLVNPDDLGAIIVLDQGGRYVCDAELAGLAPQDAGNTITAEHLERQKALEKELRIRIKQGDPRASLEFQAAQARRPALIARMAAAAQQVEEDRLAASIGGASTGYVIPRFSQIARDRASAKPEALRPILSAEQLRSADQVPDHTDAFLEDAARQQDRFGHLRAATTTGGGESAADRAEFAREMERIRADREERAKRAAALCLEQGCDAPMTIGTKCRVHWRDE